MKRQRGDRSDYFMLPDPVVTSQVLCLPDSGGARCQIAALELRIYSKKSCMYLNPAPPFNPLVRARERQPSMKISLKGKLKAQSTPSC